MGDGELPSTEHLTASECWALLRRASVGRLAVSAAGTPEIFPVNYVVDHGSVVFRTAEGTKLSAAVCNQVVAFEADGTDPAARVAWSVIVKGRALELRRLGDVLAAADLPLHPWQADPKDHFVRIVPEEITGRRFPIAPPSRWHTVVDDAPPPAAPE